MPMPSNDSTRDDPTGDDPTGDPAAGGPAPGDASGTDDSDPQAADPQDADPQDADPQDADPQAADAEDAGTTAAQVSRSGSELSPQGERGGIRSSTGSSPRAAWLLDAWTPGGRIRLDGPLERSTISPAVRSFATALLGVVATFLVFQGVASVLVGAWVLVSVPAGELQDLGASTAAQAELIGRYTREILISNSIGQVVGLGLLTAGLARLHSRDLSAFLRLRRSTWGLVGLSLLALIALQPGVQWLAELNRQIALPDGLRQFEESQLQLIETVLQSDTGLWFNVTMMAVVPGIFEELAFRGYVQRQFERSLGPAAGIVLSGGVFGLYHLRLSQVLPLTLLGIFLAYLTWRTGSLLPAILVHFAHNALAVVGARYVEQQPDLSPELLHDLSVPAAAAIAGFVFFGGILYVLHRQAAAVRPDGQDARSGAPPPSGAPSRKSG